ncbi:Tim44/TimA family putative adaptor protein [Limobrevibacterium gyesilva]|uniref:Tim44/TimA family putative adaptor protein n=1 Tax=Limobrevibacterium gyesilva TaxID=2991712 RepID=A0AA41YHQ6_9PROT|nr:Tim44/TimA family putative adaptor protein [Limobrevibacterium gyesilva]MCW3473609.1 Tim44/TimA family putative adaptor protein [Limobrevibacterium gyesilva]
MGATGGFPIDLILFGMIAAFLVLRLRSVLGRRQGFERPTEPQPQPREGMPAAAPDARAQDARVIDAVAEPAPNRVLPDPASPVGQAFARMQQVDPNFHPARFLDGAEAAFRMIVTAFAAGERETLRGLLSDDTFRAFEAAISAREAAGEVQRTEIRGFASTAIEHAELRGTLASIAVRFVSDQVNVTLGRDGLPVAGADAVTEITDLWTFERNLTSGDPTWRLVSARSA